jgi:hypothetical protein
MAIQNINLVSEAEIIKILEDYFSRKLLRTISFESEELEEIINTRDQLPERILYFDVHMDIEQDNKTRTVSPPLTKRQRC